MQPNPAERSIIQDIIQKEFAMTNNDPIPNSERLYGVHDNNRADKAQNTNQPNNNLIPTRPRPNDGLSNAAIETITAHPLLPSHNKLQQ